MKYFLRFICSFATIIFPGTVLLGQTIAISTTPGLSQDSVHICLHDHSSIDYTAVNTVGYDSLHWTFQGGSTASASGAGSHSVVYASVGSFKTTLRAYINGSLAETKVIWADVRQTGPVAFNPSQTTFCNNAPPFTLDGFSPSGGYFTGPGVNGNKFHPDQSGSGSHTIWYVVKDGACADSSSVVVNVKTSPNTVLNSLGTPTPFQGKMVYSICPPTSPFFAFSTSTPSSEYSSFHLEFGDGSTPLTGSTFPTTVPHVYPAGLYKAVLTLTAPNGCSQTDEVYVFYGSNPAVGFNISGNNQACLDSDTSAVQYYFPITNTAGNPPGTVYEVLYNDGSPSEFYNHPPPDSVSHFFIRTSCGINSTSYSNAFQAKIIARNPCASSAATVEPILVSEPAKAGFDAPDRGCVGTTVDIIDTSYSGQFVNASTSTCDTIAKVVWSISPSTYTLNSGDEGMRMDLSDPTLWFSGSPSLNVTFNDTGRYVIKQVVGTTQACKIDSVEHVICVDTAPQGDLSLSKNTVCVGDSVTGSFVGDVFQGCDGLNIEWAGPSGTYASLGNTGAFDTTQNYVFNEVGVWPINLTVSNGCDSIFLEDSVTVQAAPTVALPSDTALCGLASFDFSDSALRPVLHENLAPTGTQWGVIPATGWNVVGGTGLSSLHPQIDFTAYGTYQVFLQADNICGVRSDTLIIVFNEAPQVDPLADTVLCRGMDVNYKAKVSKGTPPFAYQWYVNDTPHNTTDSISLTNLQNSADLSFVVVDSRNCRDSISLKVDVMPVPVVNAGPHMVVCYHDTLQLSPSVNGGRGPFSYTWWPAAGLSDPGVLQPVRYPLDSSVTYFLTVTDSLGCTYSDSVTVDVYPIPSYDAGDDFVVCINAGDTILNNAVPSNGTWSGPGISANVFGPAVAGLGAHDLVYTIVDSHGCVHYDTVQATVIAQPNPEFGMSQIEGCSPLTVSFFDSSGTGGGHRWYKNGVLFSTSANPTETFFNSDFAQDSVIKIKLAFQASSGCMDSIIKTITVFPKPNAAFSFPASVCAGDSILIVNSSVIKGAGTTHQWSASHDSVFFSDPSAAEPTVYFPDFQGLNDSAYSVQLIISSQDGCSDTLSQTVLVHGRPTAYFSLPAAQCGPLKLAPTDSSAGQGLSYQWAVSPQTGVGISGGTTSSPQFDFDAPAQDTLVYRITLSVTDANGCTDVYEEDYTVYPLPTAGFAASVSDSCGPLTVDFTNTSDPNITGGQISDMNFEWDFGNGQTSQAQDPTVTFTNSGVQDSVFLVRLVAYNSFGCADTTYDTVVVRPDPVAELILGNTVSCSPFYIDSNTVRAQRYDHANSSYTWKVYDQDTVFQGQHTGAADMNETILHDGDSIYVRLVVTSLFGCTADSSDLQLFYTIENPVPNFAAVPDTLCSGETVSLYDSSSAGVNHEWFVNNSLFSTAQNPSLQLFNNSYTTDSVYSIKLRITAGSGCTDSITKNVVVLAGPLAQFSVPATCADDSVQVMNASAAGTSLTYHWGSTDPVVSISDSTAANPILHFPDNQSGTDEMYQLQLIVTNAEGCSDTAIEDVVIHSRPVASFGLPAAACGPVTVSPSDSSAGQGLSYQWSISPTAGAVSSGENTSVPQFSIDAPLQDSLVYRITLSVTDANGCTDTTGQNYTVYPLPIAGFAASHTDSCGPLTVQFTNTSDPNITGETTTDMSFDWNFGNGQSSQAQDPSVTFTNTSVGDSIFTVRLIAQNSFGCTDTLYDSIVVHPDPRAEMLVGSNVSCAPFHLDSSVIGAVRYNLANASYLWKVYDSDSVFLRSHHGFDGLNDSIPQDGDSVYVRLVVSSLFGCVADSTDLQLFYTIENPVPDFGAVPDLLCSGGTVSFYDSSSAGVNHEWFVNGNLFSTGQSPNLQLSNASYTKDSIVSIKLKITAGSGCTDSITKGVVILPSPLAQFSVPPTCADDSVQVLDASVAGSALEYRWSTTDSSVSISDTSAANPVLHFPDNQSGTDQLYPIRLIVTNAEGCRDTAMQNVTIYSRPVASFGLPVPQCGSATVQPSDASTGQGLSYQWSIGSSTGATITGAATAAPQFDFAAPVQDSLVYTISLLVTDANGCIDTLSKDYTVYPLPTADFVPSITDSCGPMTVDFTNISDPNITGDTLSDMSFEWDFGNGQTDVSASPTMVFTNTGVRDSLYTIRLVAHNALGCSDTIFDTVTVRPDPRAELDTGAVVACAPFHVDQTHVSAIPYADANLDYQWEVIDMATDTIAYTFNGRSSVNFTMSTPGDSMLVRLIVAGLHGCANDTAEQIFATISNPKPGFVLSNSAGCHPLNISITDTSSAGLSYEWYINGELQLATNANPNFTLGNSSTTVDSVYTIKLVATASTGCRDSSSQDVTVFALPDLFFTVGDVCDGDSMYFQNQTTSLDSIVQWNWNFGDGNASTEENPVHLYAAPGQYQVTLVGTDSRGCSQTLTDSVIIRPEPQADFSSAQFCGPDTACLNKPYSFTDLSSISSLGGNINLHEWDIMNDGSVEYTSANPTHTFGQSGTFDVKLKVASQYGCPDSVVRQVVVLDPLQALFHTDTSGTCGPLKVSVTDSSIGPIKNYHWELMGVDGFGNPTTLFTSGQQIPSIPTLVPNYERDTTYILKLSVSNCCDTSVYQRTFTLNPLPVAGMNVLPTSGCSGFRADFVLDGHTMGKPDSVILDFGDGNVKVLHPGKMFYLGDTLHLFGGQSHTYLNTGNRDTTYIASLTAINQCGDSTVSVPIVVHPNIVQASFAYTPQSGCEDLTVNFTDASYGGTFVGWYFDFDSINNSPQQYADTGVAVNHTYTEPGTYLVAQVVNDGCSFDTAFATVTVFDAPDPEFTHSNNLCVGDTFQFTNRTIVSSGSITFYRWSFGDGDSISQKDPVHVYDSAGVYRVWLVAGSSNGCEDSISHQVTVFDKPQVDFGYQHACLNQQPISFTDSTSVNSGTIVQTVWDFGDGNTSAQINPQHTYSNPGNYRVKLYKQSSNGCIDSAEHVVNIFPVAEAAFAYSRTGGDSCGTPQHFTFTNQSSGAAGYYWDFNFNNNPGIDTSVLNNPSFTYTDAGVYEVLLVAKNGYNCYDSIIKTVMVRPFPEAGFMADTLENCAPFRVTFTDTTSYDFNGPGGVEEWYWDFGDGQTASGSSVVSHRYETEGVFTVSLTVVTDGGCMDSVTYQQYIVAHHTPGVVFNTSKINARTFFFGNGSTSKDLNVQWRWSFGDGEISYEKSPEHTYNVDLFEQDYSFEVCLTATNTAGCDSTVCQPIDLEGYQLSVPNAFAPEQRNAGEGSVFLPKGHSLMEYHLTIYDEWGNKVFESVSLEENGIPDEAWDGTANGLELPMGSYVWKIIATFNDGTTWPGKLYKDKIRRNHGTVTLIR